MDARDLSVVTGFHDMGPGYDLVINDAVTHARRALECGGRQYAAQFIPSLNRLLGTWRGPAAQELIEAISGAFPEGDVRATLIVQTENIAEA